MLDCGHDTPLININISEKKRKSIIPVSRFGRNTDTVIEKNITDNKNGSINFTISSDMPMCGRLNECGITPRIKNDQVAYRRR